ncbi:MAG: hypothetical protein V2I27_06410 [Erythrobacter sp.]|nr:hypothetical protein [Erythrobacter sp.]
MNKELLVASLKRGVAAGLMAAAGASAWILLSGRTDYFIFPVIAGIAIFYAATMLFYFEGRKS